MGEEIAVQIESQTKKDLSFGKIRMHFDKVSLSGVDGVGRIS